MRRKAARPAAPATGKPVIMGMAALPVSVADSRADEASETALDAASVASERALDAASVASEATLEATDEASDMAEEASSATEELNCC